VVSPEGRKLLKFQFGWKLFIRFGGAGTLSHANGGELQMFVKFGLEGHANGPISCHMPRGCAQKLQSFVFHQSSSILWWFLSHHW